MVGVESWEEMAGRAWANAERSGFHDARREMEPWQADIWCSLMLMVTEIAEAAEELRDALCLADLTTVRLTDRGKPEGFLSELADVVIRIMDTTENMGANLGDMIRLKNEYNASRPFMHGRKA